MAIFQLEGQLIGSRCSLPSGAEKITRLSHPILFRLGQVMVEGGIHQ